jgi:hypothetical protein
LERLLELQPDEETPARTYYQGGLMSAGADRLKEVKQRLKEAQEARTDERIRFYRARGYPLSPGQTVPSTDTTISTVQVEDLTGSSSVTDPAEQNVRNRRIGRGIINRYGFDNSFEQEHQEEQAETDVELVGPASGLPPPYPDPRSNPPLNRDHPLRIEQAIWTGIIQEEGRLELSRVNAAGNQEWLSAIEIEPRVWKIQKSTTTRASRPDDSHGPQ